MYTPRAEFLQVTLISYSLKHSAKEESCFMRLSNEDLSTMVVDHTVLHLQLKLQLENRSEKMFKLCDR